MGRVWLRARSACPPPFPVPVCGVGVRAWVSVWLRPASPWGGVGVCVCSCARPAWSPAPPGWDCCAGVRVCARAPLVPRLSWLGCGVWACVLGTGLRCALPFLVGLSGVFFALFFWACLGLALCCRLLAVPVPGLVVPVPPSPFFQAGLLALFFFSSVVCVCMFRCPFSWWAAVPGLVLPVFAGWTAVPLWGSCLRCLRGGGFNRLLWSLRVVWWLWAVLPPPPPPPPVFVFFLGGGCLFLPLPSLGWRTHLPAFSVVFRAAVGSCVLIGRVLAPWVGWAMYTLGPAPLPAGLGPGSAGWAAAPGGCVWLWVRGLGLSVSFLLCGAGFNLPGGLPPLLPGARWPRVWPVVPVCGVLVRQFPGGAVACFD